MESTVAEWGGGKKSGWGSSVKLQIFTINVRILIGNTDWKISLQLKPLLLVFVHGDLLNPDYRRTNLQKLAFPNHETLVLQLRKTALHLQTESRIFLGRWKGHGVRNVPQNLLRRYKSNSKAGSLTSFDTVQEIDHLRKCRSQSDRKHPFCPPSPPSSSRNYFSPCNFLFSNLSVLFQVPE